MSSRAESGRAALVATIDVPFEIPESWRWVRLGNICASIADGDHQPPPQQSEGVPFLVISNVSSGTLDFSSTRFVSDEYFKSLTTERKPKRGDLLVTVTGSYGIVVPVETDTSFCFQRHMALLKTIEPDNRYLAYCLQSPSVKSYFDSVATGSAQKTVGLASLKSTGMKLFGQKMVLKCFWEKRILNTALRFNGLGISKSRHFLFQTFNQTLCLPWITRT